MNIAGLVKSSTVDFPGQLAAVIFSPGCNLDCFFCHNRPLLTGAPLLLAEEDVVNFLRKRRNLLDGVVFSGGEPTLQPDLADMIRQVRCMGFQIKLDTNGTMPDVLNGLLSAKLLDYIAIDCKAPWERYPEFCGCGSAAVRGVQQSMRILAGCGLPWEIRTTVIPQLRPEDLAQMARSLPQAPHFVLQRYNRPAVHRAEDRFRLDTAGYTPAQLVLLAEQLRPLQPNVKVR